MSFKFNQNIAVTILIISLLALHLATATMFGLSVDEAHYAMFAIKLDLSYFDHPPMVGWLLALMQPWGLNDFTIRIPAILLMAFNNFLLFTLTKKIYPDHNNVAFWAVVLFNLSPAVQLVSYAMVPDVPLMTFSLLLILLLFNMGAINSILQWLLLGVLLGGLGLSKYTAIVIPIGLIFWLAHKKLLFLWLKQWQFWLSMTVALILITPVLWWNYQNEWLSFVYQFNHGTNGTWKLKNFLIMLLLLIVAYSPLLFVFSLKGLYAKATFSSKEKLLWYIFGFSLALVLYSSGNGEFLPHWALLAFLLITPIASNSMVNFYKSKLTKYITNFSAALSLIIFISLFGLLLFKPTGFNLGVIYKDLNGWQPAAKIAQNLAQQNKIKILWVKNWTQASRIAWYARPMPVAVITNGINQYTLWNGNAKPEQTAILVTQSRQQFVQPFPNTVCNKIDDFNYKIRQVVINNFNFYYCRPNNHAL